MKKFGKYKILFGLGIAGVVLVIVLVVSIGQNPSVQEPAVPFINHVETDALTLLQVTKIATDYLAGTVVKAQQVRDNLQDLYEVQIQNDRGIFSVYVDRHTGEIVKQTRVEDTTQSDVNGGEGNQTSKPATAQPPAVSTQEGTTGQQGELTLEEAKAIALKEINGTVVEYEEDYEDGVLYYEFKISTGKKLYEIEIHAKTGLVTKVKLEDDYDYYDDYYDD